MTIDVVKYEDKTQLNVHGRVDATSLEEFQSEILKAFQGSKTVIVDFSDALYISSSGLRALLIGQKTADSKGGKFIIINASEAVTDVIRVTGLGKVLNVQ
ncbi:MAG: STAS domain-containing protein [Butyrivibrio sp.]|nr:STAS domain-containing protein [Butyrivibrio sp.]